MPREIPPPVDNGRALRPQNRVVRPSYTEVSTPLVDSIGLSDITRPLWNGKGTIAAIALLGVLVGLLVAWYTKPVYRARASLELQGFNDEHFLHELTPVSQGLPNASPENYLQNQVKLLESNTLAKRVAQKIGVPAEEGGGLLQAVSALLKPWPMTAEEKSIENVHQALSVRTSLQSQVIELFYDAPQPQLAANGANAAASEFIDLNREARLQLVQDTTEWLNQQAADLKAKLDVSNLHLQQFARSAGLVFAGQQSTLAQDRMRQVQEALAHAEADRAAKQSRYEAIMGNTGGPGGEAPDNGALRQAQVDLQNMRRQLAQLKTIYTPTNAKVVQLEAQIAETERSIDTSRKDIVNGLRTEYVAAAGLERYLSEANASQLRTVEGQMDKERQYETLKNEIDATQKLYDSTLEKVKAAGAASAMRSTNVRMIDSASVPSIPYSPKPPLNAAIGFALGSLGGICMVLMRGRTGKVTQPGQIRVLDIPELGVIPSAQDAGVLDVPRRRLMGAKYGDGELGLVTRNHHTSPLSESFRAAITSILLSTEDRPNASQTLVVTSVDPMAGKTTILANLGIAAAERRLRVLLIDADFRRPRLHRLFDLPPWGVADVLRSPEAIRSAPVGSLVRPTRIPFLSVLPTGVMQGSPGNILYSAELGELLERFRKEFDLILIDTPPMMLYSDARLLGKMSDGIVMVVRANTRSQGELESAYLRLMQDQTPVLGTILNDWRMDSRQTREFGRYYSHYQSNDQTTAA